jgi:hypothetical protein
MAAAADQFVGATKRASGQYGLVYRSISHGAIRELCLDLQKQTLPRSLVRHAPPGGFGADLAAYSEVVVELQEKRLSADYDPLKRYRSSDAVTSVVTARNGLTRFKNATETEREAFLALLVFKPR